MCYNQYYVHIKTYHIHEDLIGGGTETVAVWDGNALSLIFSRW